MTPGPHRTFLLSKIQVITMDPRYVEKLPEVIMMLKRRALAKQKAKECEAKLVVISGRIISVS
jgi:hypothetical protein